MSGEGTMRTIFALLMLPAAALAQSASLPPEVSGRAGVPFVVVAPSFTGDAADWISLDSNLAVIDLGQLLDAKVRPDRVLVFASQPGRYRLRLRAAAVKDGRATLGDPAVTTVVIGDAPAPPPPPGPTPPAPSDPLFERLKPIYGADVSPTKAADAKQLAAVFRNAVATADNASLTTLRQLYEVVRQAGASLVPLPKLDPIRQVITEELTRTLGGNDVALTPDVRAKCKSEFARVASALEGLR
jgi:hypothetical protein